MIFFIGSFKCRDLEGYLRTQDAVIKTFSTLSASTINTSTNVRFATSFSARIRKLRTTNIWISVSHRVWGLQFSFRYKWNFRTLDKLGLKARKQQIDRKFNFRGCLEIWQAWKFSVTSRWKALLFRSFTQTWKIWEDILSFWGEMEIIFLESRWYKRNPFECVSC